MEDERINRGLAILLSTAAVSAETTEKQPSAEIVPLYEEVIPYWTKDSTVMESIISFVEKSRMRERRAKYLWKNGLLYSILTAPCTESCSPSISAADWNTI